MIIDGRMIIVCFPHLIFTGAKKKDETFPFRLAMQLESCNPVPVEIPTEMPSDGED